MLNDFKISNTTDHLSLVLAHPNSTVDIGLHHLESTANVSRVSTTGSWSEWSECSRSCKQQRTRVCRRFERCNRRETEALPDPDGTLQRREAAGQGAQGCSVRPALLRLDGVVRVPGEVVQTEAVPDLRGQDLVSQHGPARGETVPHQRHR